MKFFDEQKYKHFTLRCKKNKINLTREIRENTITAAGFSSLEEAEELLSRRAKER